VSYLDVVCKIQPPIGEVSIQTQLFVLIQMHLERKKSLSFQENTQIAMECLQIVIAVGSACVDIHSIHNFLCR